MSRVTLADVIERQERLIDLLVAELHETRAATQAMFEEWVSRPQRQPSQTVELKRAATGDHTTAVGVTVTTQEGETLEQATDRARVIYEQLAGRYPMPNGLAHAAPLGAGTDDLTGVLGRSLDTNAGKR